MRSSQAGEPGQARSSWAGEPSQAWSSRAGEPSQARSSQASRQVGATRAVLLSGARYVICFFSPDSFISEVFSFPLLSLTQIRALLIQRRNDSLMCHAKIMLLLLRHSGDGCSLSFVFRQVSAIAWSNKFSLLLINIHLINSLIKSQTLLLIQIQARSRLHPALAGQIQARFQIQYGQEARSQIHARSHIGRAYLRVKRQAYSIIIIITVVNSTAIHTTSTTKAWLQHAVTEPYTVPKL